MSLDNDRHYIEHLVSGHQVGALNIDGDETILDEEVNVEAIGGEGLGMNLGAHMEGVGSVAGLEEGREGEGEG